MTRLVILLFSILLTSCAPTAQHTTEGGQEEISFYIDQLPDRDFVEVYGDDENPKTWYTAAEKLGEIGAPAIPALVQRLGTADEYELMLVVYALMLASQDAQVMAITEGDYLQLDTVLTSETNTENRQRAQRWCAQYPQICAPNTK